MAVQQNKVTRSKRDMRRSHHALKAETLSEDAVSGEKHLRHHMAADGSYRGRIIAPPKQKKSQEEESE